MRIGLGNGDRDFGLGISIGNCGLRLASDDLYWILGLGIGGGLGLEIEIEHWDWE